VRQRQSPGRRRHQGTRPILFRYNIPLVHADASKQFLERARRHDRPREGRKTIGALFLARGTLYPEVIESVSVTGGLSVTIKSHHNVGGRSGIALRGLDYSRSSGFSEICPRGMAAMAGRTCSRSLTKATWSRWLRSAKPPSTTLWRSWESGRQ
jgi:hypothetical protein